MLRRKLHSLPSPGNGTAVAPSEAERTPQQSAPPPRPSDGTPPQFCDPEPWREQINGAELLNELSRFIRRFVVVSQHAADAAATWVLAAYAPEAFDFAPPLLIRSPTKRCGKSRL